MRRAEADLFVLELVRESVAGGGPSSFIVRGRSMRPLIREGMTVHVEPLDPERARVGDVIAFTLHGRLVAHRVIGFTGGASGRTLRTKGDARAAADPPVHAGDVIGRVRRVTSRRGSIDFDAPLWRTVNRLAAFLSPIAGVLLITCYPPLWRRRARAAPGPAADAGRGG